MADKPSAKPSAPSQSDQASRKVKAEGDRENENESESESVRDSLRTGRGGLDPVEVRGVLDETSEKHRRGEDIGATGISNRTLAEEEEEQAELPERGTRKAGGGGA
jgi:hypothetical protein